MSSRLVIAFGPEAPEFGSWNWIGSDLAEALAGRTGTVVFRNSVPDCDAVVFVKFKPPLAVLKELSRRCAVLYCPVDVYGSSAEIGLDEASLRLCRTIVVHCQRLRRYFSAFAPVEYLDHHLKFIAPMPGKRKDSGPIIWIGNHSNLPAVVQWANRASLPEELWILTNVPRHDTSPVQYGFVRGVVSRLGAWTAERHCEWVREARAAVDIKGNSFRARHKPPAKALDFIASGLPLAMNGNSSPVQYLAEVGVSVPSPDQTAYWLSADYWSRVQVVGRRLRNNLSLHNVAGRLLGIIQRAIAMRV